MKPETQAIHAGGQLDPTTRAVTSPIHLSTTFERAADGTYPGGHVYNRDTNPNRNELENRLAALEGGFDAAAFASGSVAAMTLLQALKTGDHIIVPADFYFGIQRIIHEIFADWGLQASFVDMNDLDSVRDALQENTRLILTETPSNPMINITDIAAIAEIAHDAGAYLVTDNTILTPFLQNPIEHGADFVVHATTKYIGGHSDVLSGVIIAKEDSEYWQKVRRIQKVGGAVPSPFDCWLVMRGLQSLPYRLSGHVRNAIQIAEYLEQHPKIEQVLYPMLTSHPHYAIAQKQMRGGGGLMSILVAGGEEAATKVAASVKLFIRATSFGGTHSLIEHRYSVEADDTKTPKNLLRVSIGLEHPDDLIADLAQALDMV